MDKSKEQTYIEDRVDAQQKYFSNKAKSYKRGYYTLSIFLLILSLFISIISLLTGDGSINSIIIAILSAVISLIESLIFLFKCNVNWINYRLTSEQLKRERFLYLAKSGVYYNNNDDEAFNIFVQNIEEIIQNSNAQWECICNNQKGGN